VTFTCELFGCFDEIMFSPVANVFLEFLAILFSGHEETVLSRRSLLVPENNHQSTYSIAEEPVPF
jgi:hypothetical protein